MIVSNATKKNGFTLIEVLIALMIIAIALAAVIRSMHQSILVTDKVKTDMAAHWVAMNALSEIQLGMIRVPVPGNPVVGKTQMFGEKWQWSAKEESETSTSYAKRIKIIVTTRGKQYGLLYGFVRK